jgi:signal peptidase I
MPSPFRAFGRAVRVGLVWSAIGLVGALLLAAAFPFALGDRSYVVRSGSMTPAIDTGDVLVAKPVAPLDVAVGDVVTFTDPDGSGRLISHRVRTVHAVDGRVNFVTQGDANTGQEHWSVPKDGQIGQVLYRLPKLGYAIARIQTPVGRLGLIVLPALLLATSLLVRIWRRTPERGRGDELSA